MTESWIIDQLVQQGVRHICIAPGSRSTPLVLAAAEHGGAALHVHYDERGLGFLALGLSQATRQPAAVIVTSGTAVGNLWPSVMEAHHTSTSLLLLTADRPPELRDCSANQTTDQAKLFHSFVRWQADLPVEGTESYFRSIAAQGYFYTRQNPPGPVHLNIPFREPYCLQVPRCIGKPIALHFPRHSVDPVNVPYARGLIAVGRLPSPDDVLSILALAKRLQWPVCADILSNARCHPTPEQIRYFDWIEKPTPDCILHFGERLTSKKPLSRLPVPYFHISPWPTHPERIATERIQADIPEFCRTFTANTDPHWLSEWQDLPPTFDETGHFTEVHALRAIGEHLPPQFALFLGNGMPIRDADHFLFPKQCRAFFGNRGLSGIDGNIATIAGLAQEGPVLGIIGDQATLYDLNSLPLLSKTKYPALLLVSNNFGGGVFHHLPIFQSPHFERFWGAPHAFRFERAAQMFDLPYFSFEALSSAFASGQSGLIELITNRAANYQYQCTS